MPTTRKKTKTKRKTKSKTQRRKILNLKALAPGDLIEIVAPGSHSPDENLKKGAEVLRSWGFKVRYQPDLLSPHMAFLANTDQKRFSHLKKSLQDPAVKAIWSLRGGYGAIRLLPELEKMKAPKQAKLLIGLSDVCSIHAVLNQKWGWPSLHASLVDRLAQNKLTPENSSELKKVITQANVQTEFAALRALNAAGRVKRNIKSSVVGGNLMVVVSTLGTPSQICTDNKILFLEEISERAYRVDRCLQQLKQAGVFRKIKAVVIGEFLNCDEPDGKNHIEATLRSFFAEMKFPVFSGVETGHGETQRPLFFNSETHITCGDSPRMLVYSPFGK